MEEKKVIDETKLTFLPVGSVVRLKGGKMNILITGYAPVERTKDKVWDYLGAIWPTGVIKSDQNLLFNRDQIEEVIFKGYSDEVELDFRVKVEQSFEMMKK